MARNRINATRNCEASRNGAARRIRFIRLNDRSFTDRSRLRNCTSEKRNAPVSFCLVRKRGDTRLSLLMFSIDVADTSEVQLIRWTAVTIPWHLALINAIDPHALLNLHAPRNRKRKKKKEKKGIEVSDAACERKIASCCFDVSSLSDFREYRVTVPHVSLYQRSSLKSCSSL